MNACTEYNSLPDADRNAAFAAIRKRIIGRSFVADIKVEKSPVEGYDFKVTVMKYNSSRGWSTIGYLRKEGEAWKASFKAKGAARTGSYS